MNIPCCIARAQNLVSRKLEWLQVNPAIRQEESCISTAAVCLDLQVGSNLPRDDLSGLKESKMNDQKKKRNQDSGNKKPKTWSEEKRSRCDKQKRPGINLCVQKLIRKFCSPVVEHRQMQKS